MKKILITGTNSYIGNSLEKWLQKYSNKYFIDTVNMRDDSWRNVDFSDYDVVFHVAGIAHVSSDPKMKEMYYKVNQDLTIETAEYAKKAGVKQFIFMSSIIVYGDSSSGKRVIDKDTVAKPSNFYGDSKLKAEEGILPLETNNFKIVVLRPPMIYGKGSRGNYPKLAKAAQKLPVFPNIYNERSMLYIDNLCEFIRLMVENEERGLFFPQNKEYVRTTEMVKLIAEAHSRKIRFTKAFNSVLRVMGLKLGIINKVFGNLVYEQSMSEYNEDYCVFNFKESINATEGE